MSFLLVELEHFTGLSIRWIPAELPTQDDSDSLVEGVSAKDIGKDIRHLPGSVRMAYDIAAVILGGILGNMVEVVLRGGESPVPNLV